MAIDALSALSTSSGGESASRTNRSNDFGQDAFLKLLVTQLTNQDPLAPQDQQQFLAQLAQFSTVEGVHKVEDSQSRLQATNMLGKTIEASFTQDNAQNSVTGVVQNVRFGADGVLLTLQGQDTPVNLKDVTNVRETPRN